MMNQICRVKLTHFPTLLMVLSIKGTFPSNTEEMGTKIVRFISSYEFYLVSVVLR